MCGYCELTCIYGKVVMESGGLMLAKPDDRMAMLRISDRFSSSLPWFDLEVAAAEAWV